MEVSSYLPVLPAAPAAGFVFQCTWPSAAVKARGGVKESLPKGSGLTTFQCFLKPYVLQKKRNNDHAKLRVS